MNTKIISLAMILFVLAGFRPISRTIVGKVTSVNDGTALPGVNVLLKGTSEGTVTDSQGNYVISVPDQGGRLIFSFIGLKTKEVSIGSKNRIDVSLENDVAELTEVPVVAYGIARNSKRHEAAPKSAGQGKSDLRDQDKAFYYSHPTSQPSEEQKPFNTEEYDGITENIFHDAKGSPLSTFSIDVDAASYSNIRRYIQGGQRPPQDAVRIEEMVNYFHYVYPQPEGEDPFSINTEISTAPWNEKHKLVLIGLQGKKIPTEKLPPSNLVFLIDVSGSMSDPNKLPLLKSSFKLLVQQLRAQDHVAIVVYAGAAGLVLPPTAGSDKKTIIEALDRLEAGGSTAGGAGLRLAYQVAKENFNKEGNNRVILATDGDFNIGESSNGAMERLIEEKRQDGVFITVMGFGMGNYKDSKMETIADKGNGNYLYIDSILEAQKALVNEFGGTLFTIAKDVKLQIEFNPAKVQAYRLIGYENRMLKSEDFNNDKKDAGELGSGHTVTALYEIIPIGVDSKFFKVDELKYQTTKLDPKTSNSNELMTVKFRYKKPDGNTSKLIVHAMKDDNIELAKTSENFRWASSVASFGMLLRNSEYLNGFSEEAILRLAQGAQGEDKDSYRAEFISMVKADRLVASK
ncbi:MAG TPA: von Willebrand factor type A domain-containing protein [Cyclobacteriaceae bacterium]|nr:von Willebrand factor type A domain-containing protein [Cyclobacteriaceae bacterium]